jgi:hypothetical protein
MTNHSLLKPFLISLVLLPLTFAAACQFGGTEKGRLVTLCLFGITVLVEIVALWQFFRVRKSFSTSDPGYLIWTLILTFMAVRLLAEARLFTLNLNLVPEYRDGASAALFFYIVVLRYLYTLSDLFFIGALIMTIRSYKNTGLPFKVLTQDYFYMAALCTLPIVTFTFRANLIESAITGNDGYIATYRLVAVSVGAIIGSFCIVVRRFALQMGGGSVARVWNMVVIAGVARDGSFLALALISSWSKYIASFTEQYLLWIFAGSWLLAALYQSAVFSRATKSHKVYVAETLS